MQHAAVSSQYPWARVGFQASYAASYAASYPILCGAQHASVPRTALPDRTLPNYVRCLLASVGATNNAARSPHKGSQYNSLAGRYRTFGLLGDEPLRAGDGATELCVAAHLRNVLDHRPVDSSEATGKRWHEMAVRPLHSSNDDDETRATTNESNQTQDKQGHDHG